MTHKPGRVRRHRSNGAQYIGSGARYAGHDLTASGHITADILMAEKSDALTALKEGERLMLSDALGGRLLIGDASGLPFDKLDLTGADLSACYIERKKKPLAYGVPAVEPGSWGVSMMGMWT